MNPHLLFSALLIPQAPPPAARPTLLSKEVLLRHKDGRSPARGFVTYIDARRPILMHCHGWQQYSDGYDDYAVSISRDNGRKWSKEEIRWRSARSIRSGCTRSLRQERFQTCPESGPWRRPISLGRSLV